MAKKYYFAFVFSLFATFTFAKGYSNNNPYIKISTFNIKFYGLGGSMNGNPALEKRDPFLRKFISEQLRDSDVISFQEIVDVARLQNHVLPPGWKCRSYDNSEPTHQHVVLCARPGLYWSSEPLDNNDIIDAVAVNGAKSRPALHLILRNSQGMAIARVVGVHLKAFPQETTTRLFQTRVIADYLKNRVAVSSLPIVVLGDFNTYADDELRIQDIFDQYNLDLMQGWHDETYTWRNGNSRGLFDHIWFSSQFDNYIDLRVFPVCSATQEGQEFMNSRYYYQNISDHCPVTAVLGRP